VISARHQGKEKGKKVARKKSIQKKKKLGRTRIGTYETGKKLSQDNQAKDTTVEGGRGYREGEETIQLVLTREDTVEKTCGNGSTFWWVWGGGVGGVLMSMEG